MTEKAQIHKTKVKGVGGIAIEAKKNFEDRDVLA